MRHKHDAAYFSAGAKIRSNALIHSWGYKKLVVISDAHESDFKVR